MSTQTAVQHLKLSDQRSSQPPGIIKVPALVGSENFCVGWPWRRAASSDKWGWQWRAATMEERAMITQICSFGSLLSCTYEAPMVVNAPLPLLLPYGNI